jgi:hypothetical protein
MHWDPYLPPLNTPSCEFYVQEQRSDASRFLPRDKPSQVYFLDSLQGNVHHERSSPFGYLQYRYTILLVYSYSTNPLFNQFQACNIEKLPSA